MENATRLNNKVLPHCGVLSPVTSIQIKKYSSSSVSFATSATSNYHVNKSYSADRAQMCEDGVDGP